MGVLEIYMVYAGNWEVKVEKSFCNDFRGFLNPGFKLSAVFDQEKQLGWERTK